MNRLVLLIAVALIAWQGYARYQHHREAEAANAAAESMVRTDRGVSATRLPRNESATTVSFQCDGRTYCSQMTSCAEATFFLQNCPGVKMDGNNDGVPCEQQWCDR